MGHHHGVKKHNMSHGVKKHNMSHVVLHHHILISGHSVKKHNVSHVGPHSIVHHHRPRVGSKVCLTSFWRKGGPLRRGEEGVLVKDTHDFQPYCVRAPNGRKWWYFSNEIRSCGKKVALLR